MKTITIYELLGMIKYGKAPKKIKVTGTIYEYDERYEFYFTKTKEGKVALGGKRNEINLIYNFNAEVEILEEEKKLPEKLETYKETNEIFLENFCYKNLPIHKDSLSPNERVIVDKINEVLDYLGSKEKGE